MNANKDTVQSQRAQQKVPPVKRAACIFKKSSSLGGFKLAIYCTHVGLCILPWCRLGFSGLPGDVGWRQEGPGQKRHCQGDATRCRQSSTWFMTPVCCSPDTILLSTQRCRILCFFNMHYHIVFVCLEKREGRAGMAALIGVWRRTNANKMSPKCKCNIQLIFE